MTKTAFALVAMATAASAANASLLASETFLYPDGNLVGNGTWTAHSGAGNVPIQVVSNFAVLNQGSGSREDANMLAGSTLGAGQTWFASFDLTNDDGNAAVYVAHFLRTSSVFESRVFIAPPTAGGDYTIAFSNTSTPLATWAVDFNYGDAHQIVISYEFDTGVSNLWIDPASQASPSLSVTSTAGDALVGFALRQASPGTGLISTQTIDNILIGTAFNDVAAPTPGSLALLGLGGLVAVRRRR